MVQAVRSGELNAREAIVHYMDLFYTYYENYPAITAIDQIFDVLRCEPDFSGKIKNILSTRWGYLKQMIEKAQADGQISSGIDSEYISDMISGSCNIVCLKWRMDSYGFPLKERVLCTLNAISDAFTP